MFGGQDRDMGIFRLDWSTITDRVSSEKAPTDAKRNPGGFVQKL